MVGGRVGSTLILAVVLALLPILIKSEYLIGMAVVIGIHVIVVAGLCMLMGYAGQVSLGHAAFYGMGAYGSAILTVTYGLSPWLALVVAAIITMLIAYVIAIPTLRLREHYLALATLGFGVIVYIFFTEAVFLTEGLAGIVGVPYLALGGYELKRDSQLYYVVWSVAVIGMVLAQNIVDSRTGRALRSIHGSEVAAEAMGINVTKYKIQVFVLSAVYASVGGSLYAHWVTFVNPTPFSFIASIEFVVKAVIGGLTSPWGPLVGATLVTVLTEVLRDVVPRLTAGGEGPIEIVAYGVILVAVMIFMPEGLSSKLGKLFGRVGFNGAFAKSTSVKE